MGAPVAVGVTGAFTIGGDGGAAAAIAGGDVGAAVAGLDGGAGGVGGLGGAAALGAALATPLGGGGVWSCSHGLARNSSLG